MANHSSLVSLYSLCFLLLLHCCVARQQAGQQQGECQIRRLNALEPMDRVQAEAGETEFWDSNNDQFQCAGVAVLRHTIQSRGLLLPYYTNAPLLAYVVEGRGYGGVALPGCPETFQSSQQSQEQQGSERFGDRHQKIEHFRKGDVLAYPAGAAHWIYNDGDRELVVVVFFDTGNNANQLDLDPRRFFLAGNPEGEQQQQQTGSRRGQRQSSGNIFRGLDVETLAEAFKVNPETARKLQGREDQRGHIVKADNGFQVVKPPLSRREEQEEGYAGGNGLEETICTARLGENLDNPSRADIFNARAGRLSTLNSFTLPVLRVLRLSAERGVLYRNAIMAPHWNLNAHSMIYVTRGDCRAQIVDNRGEAVFDDDVREGQIVVVPQNFAIVKQAGNQGCEWISFKTNDNAMINTLAGRTSTMRAFPVDVIANAYRISRDEAQKLKFNRDETTLFSSRSRSDRVAST